MLRDKAQGPVRLSGTSGLEATGEHRVGARRPDVAGEASKRQGRQKGLTPAQRRQRQTAQQRPKVGSPQRSSARPGNQRAANAIGKDPQARNTTSRRDGRAGSQNAQSGQRLAGSVSAGGPSPNARTGPTAVAGKRGLARPGNSRSRTEGTGKAAAVRTGGKGVQSRAQSAGRRGPTPESTTLRQGQVPRNKPTAAGKNRRPAQTAAGTRTTRLTEPSRTAKRRGSTASAKRTSGVSAALPGGSPQVGLSGSRRGKTAVETHRVQPGDTFSLLAQSYYGSQKYTHFLIAGNPDIRDPNMLKIGTLLRIPPLPTDLSGRKAQAGSHRTYVVQRGDSFYGIARKVLGDALRWKELLALNKDLVDGDARKLQVGQVLRLPER